MILGSPGFVPERLSEAREARGLTMVALAQMVDVTPQAISVYERGESTPRPEVLAKISTALNVPRHRFFVKSPQHSGGAVFYRSLAGTCQQK